MKNNKWIEEFDRKFDIDSRGNIKNKKGNDNPASPYPQIKLFITKTLQEQRERIAKEIKDASDREIDGSWLPDGMLAYYEEEMQDIFKK